MSMTSSCPFLLNGNCDIASSILKQPVPVTQGACEACSSLTEPRTLNNVTVSLAIYAAKTEEKQFIKNRFAKELKTGMPISTVNIGDLGEGVGTELHKILKQRGYDAAECKNCLALIKEMNEKGPQWCVDNSRKIVNNMVKQWQTKNKLANFVIPNWLVGIKAEQLIQEAINNYAATQT